MNLKDIYFLFSVLVSFGMGYYISYDDCNKEIKELTIIKSDSINVLKDSIDNLNTYIISTEIDNQLMKDTILCFKQNYNLVEEENIVNRYKLERIRYYTDIAKKGNNIKFLRGWIYRVLNK